MHTKRSQHLSHPHLFPPNFPPTVVQTCKYLIPEPRRPESYALHSKPLRAPTNRNNASPPSTGRPCRLWRWGFPAVRVLWRRIRGHPFGGRGAAFGARPQWANSASGVQWQVSSRPWTPNPLTQKIENLNLAILKPSTQP